MIDVFIAGVIDGLELLAMAGWLLYHLHYKSARPANHCRNPLQLESVPAHVMSGSGAQDAQQTAYGHGIIIFRLYRSGYVRQRCGYARAM